MLGNQPSRALTTQAGLPIPCGPKDAKTTRLGNSLNKTSLLDHAILMIGAIVMTGPIVVLGWQLVASVGVEQLGALFTNLWVNGVSSNAISAGAMLWNSLVVAIGVAILKCVVSMLAAYALVFFRLRLSNLIFGAILLAMFFPIESRMLPTFAVTSDLGLLNSYAGMILPVTASGLGVLVLNQFLRQIPVELMEAARMDGAGPMRFFRDTVLPLSLPMIAALFAILFVFGWNQYAWPIIITTTSLTHSTLVSGMTYAGVGSPSGMALALMALGPPAIVLLLVQRQLVRTLTAGIH